MALCTRTYVIEAGPGQELGPVHVAQCRTTLTQVWQDLATRALHATRIGIDDDELYIKSGVLSDDARSLVMSVMYEKRPGALPALVNLRLADLMSPSDRARMDAADAQRL